MKSLRRATETKLATWAVLVLFAAAAWAAAGAEAQTKPFVSRMAVETVAFASLKSFPSLAERFKQSPYYPLLSEPEVKAFMEQVADKIAMEATEVQEAYERLGIAPADLAAVLSGEICVAVGQLNIAEEQIELLAAADISGHHDQVRQIVDKVMAVLQKDIDAGDLVKAEETYRDKTLVKLTPPDGAPNEVIYYMLDQDVLAVAFGGRGAMERFIAMGGEGAGFSLADSKRYKQARAHVDADADLSMYVDLNGLLRQIPSPGAMNPEEMPMPDVKQVLTALGLTQFQAVAAGYKLEQDGLKSQGIVVAPAPRGGIVRAFESASADLTPPPFVAGDASAYVGVYLDPGVLWQEIMNAIMRISPPMYQMMQMQLNNPQMGIDVQNDVIGALGGRWFGYQPAEAITAGDEPLVNWAMVVDLKDSDALRAAFLNLIAQAGMEGEPVEFEGHTIYQFPIPRPMLPDFGDDAGTAEMPVIPWYEPAVAFLPDKLIVATNVALAKTIITDGQRGRSPLLDNPDYVRASRHVLEGGQILGYSDGRRSDKGQWEQARTMLKAEEGLDLPSWETLARYRSVTMQAAKWGPDGLLIESWEPHPAGAQ